MRPFGYVRVSSRDQVDGYSLDAQERAIRQYCTVHGWDEPMFYIDAGKSGYTDVTAKRPAFARMLDDADAGGCDVVIVHRMDRFARSLATTLRELKRLQEAGVGFVSISEQQDFSTPIGRVFLAMLGALAEYFSDNLSREVKKGLAGRRAAGFRHATLPYGARLVDGVGPDIEVDPARAAHLARILELAAGHSDSRTAELLIAEHVPPRRAQGWHAESVRTLVQRAGWLADQPHPWPARYAAAVARTKRPPVRRDRSVRLLTGLMRCGHCGGRIVYGPKMSGGRGPVGLQCHRAPGPCRCLPGAPRKTKAEYYEAIVREWVASLPPTIALIRAAERLVARDDPALEELAIIHRAQERIKSQHDAGLIDDDRMYAEAAALNERKRAIAPRPPDLLRYASQVAALRESLPEMEPHAANAHLRPVISHVVITGRTCVVVPVEEMARLIDEARRERVAA